MNAFFHPQQNLEHFQMLNRLHFIKFLFTLALYRQKKEDYCQHCIHLIVSVHLLYGLRIPQIFFLFSRIIQVHFLCILFIRFATISPT